MLLIYFAVAWVIGIALSAQINAAWTLWVWLIPLPCGVAWLWRTSPHIRRNALCGLFLCLGGLRWSLAQPRLDQHHVASFNGQGRVRLVGVVLAEPDVRDTWVNLRVQAQTLALPDQKPRRVQGWVLIRAPRYPEMGYGDRLQIDGELETPPILDTFSYRDYLARQGIYSLIRQGKIRVLDRDQGNPFFALMLRLKQHAQNVIAQIIPEPAAALLTGILLGYERGIPTDLAADFSRTGTSHIIAISGFNMSIVAGLMSALSVRLFGRRYAAWFSTAAIALYTLFVGAGAAVLRAAVMSCIAVWGEHLGRQNSAPNALCATALLMTAWNPHTLWDVGFQLSFAATLGLILLSDPFQRGFEQFWGRLFPPGWAEPTASLLNDSLILTTCAQLTTLPIILYHFGSLSLVTLFSNLLVLPAQAQVMLWGALAVGGGLIWLPLGQAVGWVAWLFLSYTIWVVETTARIPYAAVELGHFDPFWVWGWYAVLGGGVWLMTQTAEKRSKIRQWLGSQWATRALIGGLAVTAVLIWLAWRALPDGKLHVAFLDVGQGDAVLIQTPDGKHVLINGGPSSVSLMDEVGRRLPFWDRTIELMILTDDRDEHLIGLVAVVERYRVNALLQPPLACSDLFDQSPICARWQAALKGKNLVAQSVTAGTEIDLGGGVILGVLYSPDSAKGPLVLRLNAGATCFLLGGSAGLDEETALLASGQNLRCDVLQIGQNGRARAGSAAFIQAVRPALAVISCVEGHEPNEAVLERLAGVGATVARTDQHGSIEVIGDGQTIQAQTKR